MTPDDLPVIGPVARRPGLWLATGHGMLGVTLAAVTAELVAAQMTGAATPVDARALAPERFA
jgi:D-amino-acid dehydrogenase